MKVVKKEPILDRDRLLESIFRISGLLTIQSDLNEILAAMLDDLVDTIGFDQGCILLAEGKYLKVQMVKNYSPKEEKKARSMALNWEKHDTLATRVFRTGRPVAVGGGVMTDDMGVSDLDRLSAKMTKGAIICAPLKAGDEVIGVIAAWCEREITFFPEEIKLFLALANQMSIVIYNVRLFDQNRRKIAHLLALEEAISAMNVHYERSGDILLIALRAAKQIAEAETAVVCLWPVGGSEGVMVEQGRVRKENVEEMWALFKGTIVEEALEKKAIMWPEKGEAITHRWFPHYPRELAIPVQIKDRYEGVFFIAKKQGTFDHDQINILDILVKNCAVFYDNSVMHAMLYAEAESLKSEVEKLKEREDELMGFHDILGRSPKMIEIFHIIAEVAEHNTNVLIQGESGTGKELIARAIHRHSSRHSKPFVDLNCAAIPANLLESELFGYEAGAFTDAKKRKIGLLEYAAGGTVLLDEIGEMPLHLQAKFLRMLEDGYVRRLGGAENIPIDVRFIFSTNRDLSAMVEQGQFREDLLYRIRVVPLDVPPLRERPEDIILLVRYFVGEFNHKLKKSITGFTKEVEEILMGYKWPGNVRELRNIVERMMILKTSGNVITPDDIPAEILTFSASTTDVNIEPLIQQLPLSDINFARLTDKVGTAVKRRIINQALTMAAGNKSHAAKLLGISRYKFIREEKKLFSHS